MNPKCLRCEIEMTENDFGYGGPIYLCENKKCKSMFGDFNRTFDWDVPIIYSEKAIKSEFLKQFEWQELKEQKGFYVRGEPEPQKMTIDEEKLGITEEDLKKSLEEMLGDEKDEGNTDTE